MSQLSEQDTQALLPPRGEPVAHMDPQRGDKRQGPPSPLTGHKRSGLSTETPPVRGWESAEKTSSTGRQGKRDLLPHGGG